MLQILVSSLSFGTYLMIDHILQQEIDWKPLSYNTLRGESCFKKVQQMATKLTNKQKT